MCQCLPTVFTPFRVPRIGIGGGIGGGGGGGGGISSGGSSSGGGGGSGGSSSGGGGGGGSSSGLRIYLYVSQKISLFFSSASPRSLGPIICSAALLVPWAQAGPCFNTTPLTLLTRCLRCQGPSPAWRRSRKWWLKLGWKIQNDNPRKSRSQDDS